VFLECVSRESGLPLELYQRWPGLAEEQSSFCFSIYRVQITHPLSQEDEQFLSQHPLIVAYDVYERPVARRPSL